MAMVMALPLPLPSNGHAFNVPVEEEIPISDMGPVIEAEQYDDSNNNQEGTPMGHCKAAASSEIPNIFSSFKNKLFGTPEAHSAATNEAYRGANSSADGVIGEPQENQRAAPKRQECDTNRHGADPPAPEPGDGFPPRLAHSPAQDADPPTAPAPLNPAHFTPHTSNTGTATNTSTPSTPRPPAAGPDTHFSVQRSVVKGISLAETSITDVGIAAAATRSTAVLQTVAAAGEYQEYQELTSSTVVNSVGPLPPSQILLTISTPPPVAHPEPAAEVAPYQQLRAMPAELDEGPPPAGPPLKDAACGCQLPECVMSRASAGASSGISAAGGAQMEHLLARVKQERMASRARAWEESAKAKASNRYSRDESKITAWENTMKAKAEARMLKAQEDLDKQRAKHIERMKNAVASAHRKAQEQRAAMEARKAEEIVKAEEIASRIRATGKMPRKCLCLTA